MPTVAVDLDDLEKLVMGTGALKTIEGAIVARSRDPFTPDRHELTGAHNRLAAAMRNAKRGDADTLVPWDGDLDEDEIKLLREIDSFQIDGRKAMLILTPEQKAPEGGAAMSVADRLAAKGCVIMGQLVKGILWAGDERPMLTPDPSGYPIKITARGAEKLAKLATPKAPS